MARTSRAAAKRLAATKRAEAATPKTLPPMHEQFLATYQPETVTPTTWAAIRETHREIMTAANIRGAESFKKRSRELASYLARRFEEGLSLATADALTYAAIDQDYARALPGLSNRSLNDRRSRLRKVAEAANPELAAVPRAVPRGYQIIKAPYTAREEAAIRRVAERQRNLAPRRNLCAVVGLCAGAGLDSVDLRHLRRLHICDLGEDGIRVEVPGDRPRTVMVRRDYEHLVRIGIDGLRPGSLVIGTKTQRHNIVGAVVDRAEILEAIPRIEASRLRHTWLAWCMTRPIPLNVLLDAAGLKSARSLIDLLDHLPEPDPSPATLRGIEDPR